jgi:Cytochrome P460
MKNKLDLTVMVFLTVIVSGCGANPFFAPTPTATATPTSTPLPPTPTATPLPECAVGDAPDFSGFESWTKVNPRPIKGHEVFVDIYVNDLAEDTYLSASGETFQVCATIVKPHLESAESENTTAITVMVKMPAGYDPDHNDWWWGMYDKEGKTAEMSGQVQVCIACHLPAANADYVFSQKVLEESQK